MSFHSEEKCSMEDGDTAFNSPEFFSDIAPVVSVLESGKEPRGKYGHRYGSELLSLTEELMAAMRAGKQLAVEIMGGEYVLFIEAEGTLPSDKP